MRYTNSWTSVFYAFGVFGIFWLMFWFVLIYNHPNRHPFISQREKQFLNRAINTVDPEDVSFIATIIITNKLITCNNNTLDICYLGQVINSMEKYCNIRTSMGIDHCSDRSRLGFVHHNYRLAEVYEVSAEVLSSRSINTP